MTLNLIDNKMIVKNTIELQPTTTITSASEFCSQDDYNALGVEGQGTYGQLDAKFVDSNSYTINDVNLNKTFIVNDKFDELIGNNSIVEFINNIKTEDSFNINNFENKGLYLDNSTDYKFGVEKVKQKFLVDDEGFYKKKAIKNIYRYYRENLQHKVLNPNWGFSNYNCLNFFNINNSINPDRTHRNCLAYPNPYTNNKNSYTFLNNSDNLTISFYVNQNNKNSRINVGGLEKVYHFNPGCILFIPGIIGIYLVKGSNVDTSGLTDSFRILLVLGDDLDKKTEIINFINQNIDNTNEVLLDGQNKVSFYLSKDNIIKFNNWHNVCIKLSKTGADDQNSYSLITELFVDNVLQNTDSVTIVNGFNDDFDSYMKVNGQSYLTIGNKFTSADTDQNEIFKKLFSVNQDSNNDFIGPYTRKHISFGSNLNDSYFESGISGIDLTLDNKIEEILDGSNYVTNDTSFALTAEIHDIRIYDKIINDIKYLICDNSVEDFASPNLIFSIPVYYYDTPIKRESLINLNGISNTNLVDASTEIGGVINNNFNVSDLNVRNLLFNSPVNHYFSNKCGGHEVIVENFVYEFVNKVSPNVIFTGDINSDQTSFNLMNLLSFNEDNLSNPLGFLNTNVKSGTSINEIYNEKLSYQTRLIDNTNRITFFDNYFTYRNNFILPCDNGLQNQLRYNVLNYYQENNEPNIHKDEINIFDLGHISLVNTITDSQILESNNLLSECSNRELFDYTQDLGELELVENRLDFKVNDNISFKENYDNFKNVSLDNYFRENFTLSDNQDNIFLRYKNRLNQDISYIEIGNGRYFKDLSNPMCRKINDDFVNSIASYLPSIDIKRLDSNVPAENYIQYYKHEFPIYNLFNSKSENYSKFFCISSNILGRHIEKESIEIFDTNLAGTFGSKKIRLKDNGKGVMYRADSETPHADWNYIGHCFYKEGIISVLHPSLENFGEFNYKLTFKSSSKLHVHELNLPAYAGRTNKSYNESRIEDLRLDESAFNSDEDFVYITDINLHDENLNILAKAKIVKPYPKKDTDNVLFRLKMDY